MAPTKEAAREQPPQSPAAATGGEKMEPSSAYKEQAFTLFKNTFRGLSVTAILRVFHHHEYDARTTFETLCVLRDAERDIPTLVTTTYEYLDGINVRLQSDRAVGKQQTQIRDPLLLEHLEDIPFFNEKENAAPSSPKNNQEVIVIDDTPHKQAVVAAVPRASTGDDAAAAVAPKQDETCEMKCGVCFGDYDLTEMFPCNNGDHLFCSDCLRHYVEEQVWGKSTATLTCMAMGGDCQAEYPEWVFARVFSQERRQQLNEQIFRNNFQQAEMNDGFQCPQCASLFTVVDMNVKAVQCPECKLEVCPRCQEAPHPTLTCKQSKSSKSQEGAINRIAESKVKGDDALVAAMFSPERRRAKPPPAPKAPPHNDHAAAAARLPLSPPRTVQVGGRNGKQQAANASGAGQATDIIESLLRQSERASYAQQQAAPANVRTEKSEVKGDDALVAAMFSPERRRAKPPPAPKAPPHYDHDAAAARLPLGPPATVQVGGRNGKQQAANASGAGEATDIIESLLRQSVRARYAQQQAAVKGDDALVAAMFSPERRRAKPPPALKAPLHNDHAAAAARLPLSPPRTVQVGGRSGKQQAASASGAGEATDFFASLPRQSERERQRQAALANVLFKTREPDNNQASAACPLPFLVVDVLYEKPRKNYFESLLTEPDNDNNRAAAARPAVNPPAAVPGRYAQRQTVPSNITQAKHLQLDLWNGIGDTDAKAVAVAEMLKTNTHLTHLRLVASDITDVGLASLAEAISINTVLQYLHFQHHSHNSTRHVRGVAFLASAIPSSNLLEFRLFSVTLGGEAGEVVDKLLTPSSTLKRLTLRKCRLGPEDGERLAVGLADNCTLERLDLYHNKLGDAGAIAIAKSLTKNKTLKFLILDDNNIGKDGMKTLVRSIGVNEYLEFVSIEDNFGTEDPPVAEHEDVLVQEFQRAMSLTTRTVQLYMFSHSRLTRTRRNYHDETFFRERHLLPNRPKIGTYELTEIVARVGKVEPEAMHSLHYLYVRENIGKLLKDRLSHTLEQPPY